MYGTDLDADHPGKNKFNQLIFFNVSPFFLGFKDPIYRKRRKIFSEVAIFYKM